VGPYGSAATLLALGEAERARRVMVNGAGPSRTVHRRAPKYVFQVVAPYAGHAEGVVELIQAAGCRRLFITARDDAVSGERADGARRLALARGMEAAAPVAYGGATLDFASVVDQARTSGADAWLAFGEARDVAEILRTSRERSFAPPVFFSDAAGSPRLRALAGQWIESALGIVEYDARLKSGSNGEFVKAYSARWSSAPDAAAAAGYAAASVLAAGARRAGSFEPEALRGALASLEVDTVLGRYRVDPADGSQAGIRPAVVQVIKGRAEIVWPPASRTLEAKLACR
jgi:branched-chain amino acid transport system substrate-binding protein